MIAVKPLGKKLLLCYSSRKNWEPILGIGGFYHIHWSLYNLHIGLCRIGTSVMKEWKWQTLSTTRGVFQITLIIFPKCSFLEVLQGIRLWCGYSCQNKDFLEKKNHTFDWGVICFFKAIGNLCLFKAMFSQNVAWKFHNSKGQKKYHETPKINVLTPMQMVMYA